MQKWGTFLTFITLLIFSSSCLSLCAQESFLPQTQSSTQTLSLTLLFFLFLIGSSIGFYRLKRQLRKRKLTEKKLKRSNERLQKMMEELKIAIKKTADAHQIKSQFLANMSHELKTPMNTIIGMGELLVHKKLPEKEQRCLHKIVESAHHLMDIINDILDFSKIEANAIELKTVSFDLEKLLLSLSELFRIRAQQKGIELLIDLDKATNHPYKGDPKRLKQVLFNLLSNAVKFTQKGEILLKVSLIETQDENEIVHFAIKDTGIGIEPKQTKDLFNAFSQADMSTTRHYEGVGLGLSIAQGLVLMMGGEIQYKSTLGEGSTFWFEIPLQKDQTDTIVKTPARFSSLNVLIVEPNHTALKIFETILNDFGVTCFTCNHATDALKQLESGLQIHAVMLSCSSDSLENITLFHTIKHRFWNKIPTILVMNPHEKELILSKLGASKPYKILLKPLTASILFETVAEVSQNTFQEVSLSKSNPTALYKLAALPNIQDEKQREKIAFDIFATEGIHAHYAIESLGGNHSFYRELLKIFVSEQSSFLKSYHALARANDTIATKRMCHTLKGISATLGMEELCTLAQYAECLEHPLPTDSTLLEEIEQKIAHYTQMICTLYPSLHVKG